MEPVHPETAPQTQRRPGPILKRPDDGAGEEVRKPEIPLPARKKKARQGSPAQ